jgi:hypothetical protein
MTNLNIRNEADRNALTLKGFTWVTVAHRGESRGAVRSKHRTYAAADKAAKGKDRMILEVREAHTF